MAVTIRDLGIMDYRSAHDLQLECVDKQLQGQETSEVVLITEHFPVFTLGRQGNLSGLLQDREEIAAAGVDIVHTERGGDITYHGPGQLVVYPILDLRRRKVSVTEYIFMLENIMLKTIAEHGVIAARDGRNRGAWVGDNKIGSVGITVRHGIAFHGLALNVNLSLQPFQWIHACGLQGVGVTSLEKVLQRAVDLDMVKETMCSSLRAIFD